METMEKQRKSYSAPKLTVHGTVEKVTQGKQPGSGDATKAWPPGKVVNEVDAMGGVGKGRS
jgi:hypothetical protein